MYADIETDSTVDFEVPLDGPVVSAGVESIQMERGAVAGGGVTSGSPLGCCGFGQHLWPGRL